MAGPRDRGTGLPRRLDVLGTCMTGDMMPWTFETLTGGRGRAERAPTWRLRPGFGVTEGQLITVGLALAFAVTEGADEAGQRVRRRLGSQRGHDVVVIPDHVTAARPLTDLPIALVITTAEPATALLAEMSGTSSWSITSATTV
ncbi:MAG: hypothetical protein Q4G43_16985 [Mobilicoccus sp.]|nr:hypothetical protein [Mobilicoccus sp.]